METDPRLELNIEDPIEYYVDNLFAFKRDLLKKDIKGELVLRFVRIDYKDRKLNFGLHSKIDGLVELMSNKPGVENLRKSAIGYIQVGTNVDRKTSEKDVEDRRRRIARF